MNRNEIKACILRTAGTNCDAETKRACQNSGMNAEIVRTNKITKNGTLLDYDLLVIPGGFSHGDYVRAGAIWAKQILAKLRRDIEKFANEERPILGICNGFQVLIEAGLLPKFNGISPFPEAALGTNFPIGYNCRWTYLRHENRGTCVFSRKIPPSRLVQIPVAHSEGRFIFQKENEIEYLNKLKENDQLIFRYCHENGQYALGEFPENPNGSLYDIAGICDPTGTILGLMPHPERAYFGWQLPTWTRCETMPLFGDGKIIFDSVAEYLLGKI